MFNLFKNGLKKLGKGLKQIANFIVQSQEKIVKFVAGAVIMAKAGLGIADQYANK